MLLLLGISGPNGFEQPSPEADVNQERALDSIQPQKFGEAPLEPVVLITTPKPPAKIEQEAFAVRRLAPETWRQLKEAHNLSLAPRRIFFSAAIPVEVNLAPLRAAREKAVDHVQFDLGLDEPVVAEVLHRFDHGANAWSLAGKLDNNPESEFSVSIYEDAVVGSFKSSEFGTRQLRYTGAGVHRVEKVNEALMPRCAVDQDPAVPEVAIAEANQPVGGPPLDGIPPELRESFDLLDLDTGEGDSKAEGDLIDTQQSAGTVMDVMVVYSTTAKNNEGGLNPMLALINQGITDTNVAFQSSSIDLEVRLVGTSEVTYTVTAAQTALNNVRSSTDNVLDDVHALRNTYGADFVSFWTPLSDACGIASLITTLNVSQEHRAFGVCDPDCQFGVPLGGV
ncbi:MAG: hypothetical protein AAF585_27685, partial [Verrucomicrobiota bacterium]